MRAIVIENVDYANTLDKVGHFSNAVYADWVENTCQELEESRRSSSWVWPCSTWHARATGEYARAD